VRLIGTWRLRRGAKLDLLERRVQSFVHLGIVHHPSDALPRLFAAQLLGSVVRIFAIVACGLRRRPEVRKQSVRVPLSGVAATRPHPFVRSRPAG
jgi:hypothetical protein